MTRLAPVRLWAALMGVLGGVWALAAAVQRTPVPAGPDAPAEQFSEGRALATVRRLADDIGPHPISSTGAAEAARFLADELRRIDRVEVEEQDATGVNRIALVPEWTFHYRVRNVLARLPGRRPDALLLNAHYDSPPESPGASDNGGGTAVMLETMRALASGPPLENTVILLLNGGEEVGQLGAAGFLKHRWAKDVRAFIDADGSGRGKAVLLLANGPARPMLDAYARTSRSPHTSVIYDDAFRSGATGAAGDGEILARLGVPGLGFSALGDTYGVHTHLDTSSRLEPGTLQSLGDTIHGVASALARAPFEPGEGRSVYYDLLGTTVVVYAASTARLLALAPLLGLALLVAFLFRRRAVAPRRLVAGLGWSVGAVVAGAIGAIAAALLVAVGLGRPNGWFAAPWLTVPAFGGAALTGVLAVHAAWRRRALARGVSVEEHALTAWVAGAVGWAILLALATGAEAGLGYLALWWLAPTVVAIGISRDDSRLRWAAWLGSVAVGSALPLHLANHLVPAAAGMAGRFGAVPIPADLNLAFLQWAFVVLPLSLCGIAGAHRVGQLGRAVAVAALLAAIGLGAIALREPYTSDRPTDIIAAHTDEGGDSHLLLQAGTFAPIDRAFAGIAGLQPVRTDRPRVNTWAPDRLPGFSHALRAAPTGLPPPRLELIAEQPGERLPGLRTVRVRLHATGWATSLELPRDSLASWSLGDELPIPFNDRRTVFAWFVAPDAGGEELTLSLRGDDPVRVTLRQVHFPAATAELDALRRALPSWTALKPQAVQVVETHL